MKKLTLALFLSLIFSIPAHALFEIRAGYGVQMPGSEASLGTGTELQSLAGFNVDAIAEIPLLPFGLGIRYETMEFALGGTLLGSELDSELTRLSVIVNYRIIDLFLYLGIIGTVGVSNTAKIKGVPNVSPPPTNYDQEFENSMDFTAGVEAGVSLGLFMVGAELGYYMGGDWEETGGYQVTGGNLNLDGIYAKAIVGIGF